MASLSLKVEAKLSDNFPIISIHQGPFQTPLIEKIPDFAILEFGNQMTNVQSCLRLSEKLEHVSIFHATPDPSG